MVLALSVTQINEQLLQLCECGIIDTSWKAKLDEYGTQFEAEINELKLLVLDENLEQLLFIVSFKSGILTCWDGFGPNAVKKELDMQSWRYAFNVNIAKIEYKAEHIIEAEKTLVTREAENQVKRIVQDSGISAKHFTVESLFLDFENANIADYNDKQSIFNANNVVSSQFQTLMTNYFKPFKGSANPYILGYNLTLLPELSKIPEPLFQPTYCSFSRSYNKTEKLQALNFLMMTEDRPKPKSQPLGLLNKSLISSEESQGAFAITFPLFRSKVLLSIAHIIQNVLSDLISKEAKKSELNISRHDSDFWSNQTVKSTSNPTNGELEIYGVDYEFKTKSPWKINIEANSSTSSLNITEINSSFTENTDIFLTVKIVDKTSVLNILVELVIETKQNIIKYSNDVPTSPIQAILNDRYKPFFNKDGYQNNKEKPSLLSIVIKADTEGKLSVSTDEVDKGEFKKELLGYNGFDENLQNGVNIINTSFREFGSRVQKQLSIELSKYFELKVILPFGNVYMFKNIRMYEAVDKCKAQDNAIVCDITYAPKYTSGKE